MGCYTFGTAGRGLGGTSTRLGPSSLTKCNSPPISGQCTNHRMYMYNGPLLCGFNMSIKVIEVDGFPSLSASFQIFVLRDGKMS